MQEIPNPEVLDPDRLIAPERDDTIEVHRDHAAAALNQLRDACSYGRALHQELAAVGAYLETAVPADTGDESAWRSWRAVYASVLSSLAGPQGDNGFGAQEATRIAQEHGAAGAPA